MSTTSLLTLSFQNKIFSAILFLSILMILDFALFLSSLRKLDQWIACIGLYGFWWSINHFEKKVKVDSLIFLNFYVLFFYVTVQYIKNINISLQIKIVPKVQNFLQNSRRLRKMSLFSLKVVKSTPCRFWNLTIIFLIMNTQYEIKCLEFIILYIFPWDLL